MSQHYTTSTFNLQYDESSQDSSRLVNPLSEILSKRCLAAIRRVIWGALIILGAAQFGIFVLMMAFISTETTGFEADTPDFALYKNTRFKDCSFGSPANVNCTMLHVPGWQDGGTIVATQDVTIILDISPSNPEFQNTTWCEIASCLKDFKVIPSSPRPSAFGLKGLMSWAWINMSAIALLWAVKQQIGSLEHYPEDCEGIGVVGWGVMAYSLASFAIWLHSFSRIVLDKQRAAPASFLAWISTWVYAVSLHFHPLSCKLYNHPTMKKVVMWVLYLVALLHWGASCYLRFTVPVIWGPKYDCLESQIILSPGTSHCSPTRICSIKGLFDAPGFPPYSSETEMNGFIIFASVYFVIVTMCAGVPFLLGVLIKGGLPRSFSKPSKYSLLFAAFAAAVLLLLVDIALPVWIARQLKRFNREGEISYELDCQVLHVALSPWRQYFDVNEYGRAFRGVKMFLNT